MATFLLFRPCFYFLDQARSEQATTDLDALVALGAASLIHPLRVFLFLIRYDYIAIDCMDYAAMSSKYVEEKPKRKRQRVTSVNMGNEAERKRREMALDQIGQQFGLNRSQLFKAIADGELEVVKKTKEEERA